KSTSHGGFDAEWRTLNVLTFEGDMLSRCELFDETDLDAAIARFEELLGPAPRLENAASRVGERILAQFAIRDWDDMADLVADNFCNDDRRRVVGAGVRHGRDALIVDTQATAALFPANVTPNVIATRGNRLVLSSLDFSGHQQDPEAFIVGVEVVL